MSSLSALSFIRILRSLDPSSSVQPERKVEWVAEKVSEGGKFTESAYTILNVACGVHLIAALCIIASSLRMNANKRQFHQMMVLVQAIALLGYSLSIGGYGVLELREETKHVLIGNRDEFLINYLLPIVCLPFIVHTTNNIAGIFVSEGVFIIATSTLGSLYGMSALWLPRNWLGSLIGVMSIIFGFPYILALLNTWPASVKAAPKRVRIIVKAACVLQVAVIVAQIVIIDLAMNSSISVDLESMYLTISNLVMYGLVPLVLTAHSKALLDVFSREEYIKQTTKATAAVVSSTYRPPYFSDLTNNNMRDSGDKMNLLM